MEAASFLYDRMGIWQHSARLCLFAAAYESQISLIPVRLEDHPVFNISDGTFICGIFSCCYPEYTDGCRAA